MEAFQPPVYLAWEVIFFFFSGPPRPQLPAGKKGTSKWHNQAPRGVSNEVILFSSTVVRHVLLESRQEIFLCDSQVVFGCIFSTWIR